MSQYESQIKIFDKQVKNKYNYRLENYHMSYIKRLFNSFKFKENAKYLDIGCGGLGHTVIEVAKKGFFAVGIDLSLE